MCLALTIASDIVDNENGSPMMNANENPCLENAVLRLPLSPGPAELRGYPSSY